MSTGRKLFGGYKITPRPCQGTTSAGGVKESATGICMFNYECSRRSGEVVGTCTDSFLFGACCKLPLGAAFSAEEVDELSERPASAPDNVLPTPSPPAQPAPSPEGRPPLGVNNYPSALPTGGSVDPLDSAMINELFLSAALHRPPAQGTYASPDTVLVHKNGSVVAEEPQNLEELLQQHAPSASLAATSKSPPDNSPELTTFSYVTGPGGVVFTNTDRHSTASSAEGESELQPTTKLVSHASTGRPYPSEPSAWDQILQSNSIPTEASEKASTKPYVTSSTTFYTQPPRLTKPTFYSSTTKWHSSMTTQKLPSFRPKPQGGSTPSPSWGSSKWTKKPSPSPSPSDDFVQVPLVSANSQSGVTVPDTEDNIEVATNAASISHILSILNNSSPTLMEADPMPEPEAHPDPHNSTSGISTWVSVNGNKPKPQSQQNQQFDDDTFTTPSKEYPTDPTSNLVTLSTFYHSKRPVTSTGYYTSVPTRRPPASTTVKVHGPAFGVKPSSPQLSSRPPPTSYYSPEPNTAYETTVLFNPAAEQETYNYPSVTPSVPSYHYSPTPEPSYHYSPTSDPSFHYSPYPPTPPPPLHSHYEQPVSPPSLHYSPSPAPPVPSSSLRPPKPSQVPPPAPTVIVLGPYDPVTNNYPNKRPVSSTTESSVVPSSGLVYTQIPANNAQGGTVTIITKRPSRPSSSTTVTKRTPITISTDSSYTTPGPEVDIVQGVSAYPSSGGTISPGRPPSENDLVAFPPVRDPNLNVTNSYPGHTTIEDEDYTEYPPDYTTPHLDDSNLNNKVHGFVDKIVQSLQGNFEELENVLFSGDNTTSAKPSFYTTTTRRPTVLSTLVSSLRPTRYTTKRPPTTRPTKPSSTTITITTTKKPTKRPTTQSTTRRPSTTYATTKRPRPSTSPTKKPKPTKKKPTTTPPPEEDEEDWSSTSGYGSSTASSEDLDYRSRKINSHFFGTIRP